MQPDLQLTEQDRLCFMQALNATAWAVVWRSAEKPGDDWLTILGLLGGLLAVAKADYQFRVGAHGIAEKINQIGEPRARWYFLRIIRDVHHSEYASLENRLFANTQKVECRDRFQQLYDRLIAAIRLD